MTLADLQRGRDEAAAREQSRAIAEGMPPYLTLPGETFDAEAAWLMMTYLAPFVRIECADIVARYARASMDVSDGLAADAAKMAEASNVALQIEIGAIPLAIPALRWVQTGGDVRQLIVGGDDYVVLFTAPPDARAALAEADPDGALRLSRIGRVVEGQGVTFVDVGGDAIAFGARGYVHRLGC